MNPSEESKLKRMHKVDFYQSRKKIRNGSTNHYLRSGFHSLHSLIVEVAIGQLAPGVVVELGPR